LGAAPAERIDTLPALDPSLGGERDNVRPVALDEQGIRPERAAVETGHVGDAGGIERDVIDVELIQVQDLDALEAVQQAGSKVEVGAGVADRHRVDTVPAVD